MNPKGSAVSPRKRKARADGGPTGRTASAGVHKRSGTRSSTAPDDRNLRSTTVKRGRTPRGTGDGLSASLPEISSAPPRQLYEKSAASAESARRKIRDDPTLLSLTDLLASTGLGSYASTADQLINRSQDDMLGMYGHVKDMIDGLLRSAPWDSVEYTIDISVGGRARTINLLLAHLVLRHMRCVELFQTLVTAAGPTLVAGVRVRYFLACLQATLPLFFTNTAPPKLLKRQNVICGEEAGRLWDSRHVDVVWGESEYDTHEKVGAAAEGGVDLIHGNFVKLFMQTLGNAMLANIRESTAAPLSKQNELMLHNKQIYSDMRTTIVPFLFNVLMNYATFGDGGTGGIAQGAATGGGPVQQKDEMLDEVGRLINQARKDLDDKGFIRRGLQGHLDDTYKKFVRRWGATFARDVARVKTNYEALQQEASEVHSPGAPAAPRPNDMMKRLDQVPTTVPLPIRDMFNRMLMIDGSAWTPLLLPAKTEAKSMKVYMNTWAKHALGKIAAVRRVLLSPENRLVHDSLEFQNGNYGERQIQVVVYDPPPGAASRNPPHYDIRVVGPELTATQFFNALATQSQFPNFLGRPVPARLSPPGSDGRWQDIELGDPAAYPPLERTTPDWVGPDMSPMLPLDAPPGPEELALQRPPGFVQDSTLLPGKNVAFLFAGDNDSYFRIRSATTGRPERPAIDAGVLDYLDSAFISPGLAAAV